MGQLRSSALCLIRHLRSAHLCRAIFSRYFLAFTWRFTLCECSTRNPSVWRGNGLVSLHSDAEKTQEGASFGNFQRSGRHLFKD